MLSIWKILMQLKKTIYTVNFKLENIFQVIYKVRTFLFRISLIKTFNAINNNTDSLGNTYTCYITSRIE